LVVKQYSKRLDREAEIQKDRQKTINEYEHNERLGCSETEVQKYTVSTRVQSVKRRTYFNPLKHSGVG